MEGCQTLHELGVAKVRVHFSDRVLYSLRKLTKSFYAKRGTGLPRLAELIRRCVARAVKPGRVLLVNDFAGESRFYCFLKDHMGGQIFFRGAYSGDQLPLLVQILNSESAFIDIGANQGEFSICAAALMRKGKVYAFEPVALNLQRLRMNVKANGYDHVEIYPLGLGDKNQDMVPIYGANSEFGDGSQNSGLPTIHPMANRTSPIGEISIRTLDSTLPQKSPPVDLIKIDVEGAELAVLQGAQSVVKNHRPYILFEVNQATAEAAGFRVEDLFVWFWEREYQLALVGYGGELSILQEGGSFFSDGKDGNLLAIPNGKPVPLL